MWPDHEPELVIFRVSLIRVDGGETVSIIQLGSYKALKSDRFRSKMREDIKRVCWNSIRELRDNGRGR
jgi:hypothetical protein